MRGNETGRWLTVMTELWGALWPRAASSASRDAVNTSPIYHRQKHALLDNLGRDFTSALNAFAMR